MPTILRTIGLGVTPGIDPRTVRRRADAMLASLGREHEELSLVLCDDATIAEYNLSYRGKDRPTDVLSFPLEELDAPADRLDPPGPDEPPVMLGDVIISLPTAQRQAPDGVNGLRQEVTRLLAHGLLHLLGWDHVSPDQAKQMERKTEELIAAAAPRLRRSAT